VAEEKKMEAKQFYEENATNVVSVPRVDHPEDKSGWDGVRRASEARFIAADVLVMPLWDAFDFAEKYANQKANPVPDGRENAPDALALYYAQKDGCKKHNPGCGKICLECVDEALKAARKSTSSPSGQATISSAAMLGSLELCGIIFHTELTNEDCPWEVSAKPHPCYFATLTDAVKFLARLAAAPSASREPKNNS